MTARQHTQVDKEQFRTFLDKAGVVDAFTQSLVALYETHQNAADKDAINPLQFIKENMSNIGQGESAEAPDKLRAQNDRLTNEVARLQKENADLKAKLDLALKKGAAK